MSEETRAMSEMHPNQHSKGDPAPDLQRSAFKQCIQVLARLLDLPAGWNSYSAQPITQKSVGSAIRFVSEFLATEMPAPAVIPRVQGGVQLEWHHPVLDVEVYVDADGTVSLYAERPDTHESIEGPLEGHEETLRTWLTRISTPEVVH